MGVFAGMCVPGSFVPQASCPKFILIELQVQLRQCVLLLVLIKALELVFFFVRPLLLIVRYKLLNCGHTMTGPRTYSSSFFPVCCPRTDVPRTLSSKWSELGK